MFTILLSENEFLDKFSRSYVSHSKSTVSYNGVNSESKRIQTSIEYLIRLPKAKIHYPNLPTIEEYYTLNTGNGYYSDELAIFHSQRSKIPLSIKNNTWFLEKMKTNKIKTHLDAGYIALYANYSSFLLGELPKIRIYEKILPKNYQLLLHGEPKAWQFNLLNKLGFQRNRLIITNSKNTIETNNIYFANPTFLHHSIKNPDIYFLRDRFNCKDATIEEGSKYYFSRSKLGEKQDRFIRNEIMLENFLKTQGIQIIHPQDISPTAQAEIFKYAETIISPFGATWANGVFRSKKSTSIIISTKNTPEFTRIFSKIGCKLLSLNIPGKKIADGPDLSSSYEFSVDHELLNKINRILKSNQ